MMTVCRLKQMAGYGALLLMAGMLYGIFVTMAGFGLPCIFHAITGLQCPGCGITHMCVALLHLDFHQAFLAHPVIFSLLPLWTVSLIKNVILYVRTGNRRLTRMENLLLYGSIAALLVYGVYRNM